MKIENKTPFLSEALPMMDHGGNPVLVVIVKGTFSVGEDGAVTRASKPIPVAYGDEPCNEGKGVSARWESDVVPFKPRADIVLTGKAHAPGEKPAPWVDVTLRVGTTTKSLRVFGDRKWVCEGKKLTANMTPPIPFETMDLLPERAFGGMDMRTGGTCAENPAGCGYFDQEVVEDPEKAFLPNMEDPKNLVRHWKDHPRPAGFGVVGKGCRPRIGYLGTYDETWEKERSPAPPVDFRPDFFNAAQPDLQVQGYLKGDEEVELVNLTFDGRFRFRLPGVRPAVTVARADIEKQGWDATRATEDLEMRLDTLCLIPDERRFLLVWRGSCAIRDLGALEIREVTIIA
ncbi:MAG: DUF2169 domain-containing protein [Deltaproteobacteria bacterium]|nr:DUF2169 domain-containing protein [Deltaproteobacteria bacterium]